MEYTYKYPRPAVTADCVVMTKEAVPRVLLIKRGADPYKGCWAFPGGFMNMDEMTEQCAIRELEEETDMKVSKLYQIGAYSKVDRDPRGRTRKQLFTTDKRCLKLSTIKSFKGWESPSVIVILDDEYNSKAACYTPMEPEMMYTAITRARENLYVINIGNETYDQFFKEQTI